MLKPHSDRNGYWNFTGPMRLDKAVHTLDGILTGISSDGEVSGAEIASLMDWVNEYRHHAGRHPFNEIIPLMDRSLGDGRLDTEEIADLKWLLHRLDPDKGYFDTVTQDMQKLQGILGGIVADGYVSDEEVESLIAWMNDNKHLRACWPFTELEALLLEVKRDEVIDDRERQLLLTFFSEWTTIRGTGLCRSR